MAWRDTKMTDVVRPHQFCFRVRVLNQAPRIAIEDYKTLAEIRIENYFANLGCTVEKMRYWENPESLKTPSSKEPGEWHAIVPDAREVMRAYHKSTLPEDPYVRIEWGLGLGFSLY